MPPDPSGAPVLRVCALYPRLMNIYADRGNLLMLERRCAWRGLGFSLRGAGIGERLDGDEADLYYMGGGQDRDQVLCAEDLLATKAAALRRAAGRGAVVLGVCGGYQLLGHSYELAEATLPGAGLLDVRTHRHTGPRLIGNVAVAVDLTGAPGEILAGFENHGGRTRLGTAGGTRPLGRVLRGHGNDGTAGTEGAQAGTVIGTYLHGPLLPKNAWFADWLIRTCLGLEEIDPLDDELERAAHLEARRAAGV